MKKIIYILSIVALLLAYTDRKQKTDNSELEPTKASIAELIETNMEQPTKVAYSQCPLAYLVEGELYFYYDDDNIKVKFVEETESIFNFTFDTEGETLYYSVERNGSLWLKLADITESTISPAWLVDWGLIKNEFISDTDGGPSALYYYKGELVSQYNYSYDSYDFNKTAIYSIANKKVIHKGYDYDFNMTISGELSSNIVEQYFQTVDKDLYYSNNNTKVTLSNQLNLDEIQREWNEEYWNVTEFDPYSFSLDKTKILFIALIWQAEHTQGPYCISNIDGSKQMVLEKTNSDYGRSPVWLKNNKIAFIDTEKKLFVADNDKNSIHQIAEDVMIYVAR